MTETKTMLTYARICVEVKAENELPEEIQVKINTCKVPTVSVEYPWKPLLCTKCQVFGHSMLNCERIVEHQRKQIETQKPGQFIMRNRNFNKFHGNGGNGGKPTNQVWTRPKRAQIWRPRNQEKGEGSKQGVQSDH
ncbi:hypothetical protein FRX31_012076 [Thalictrum thalictroides]|uniref:Zinc knuckle (CCHC-type) family protein n=1 Tax=Thalictrum thalictroides TaxID=46969 RepID=A0A7J6WLU3_THATH|nr:hypothetical protein FRX31_012076 [Thalictrum thalictroides]